MNDRDDMLRPVHPVPPDTEFAVARYLERKRNDDSLRRGIERIRARNQRIRRLYGLPERVYPPLPDPWEEERSRSAR